MKCASTFAAWSKATCNVCGSIPEMRLQRFSLLVRIRPFLADAAIHCATSPFGPRTGFGAPGRTRSSGTLSPQTFSRRDGSWRTRRSKLFLDLAAFDADEKNQIFRLELLINACLGREPPLVVAPTIRLPAMKLLEAARKARHSAAARIIPYASLSSSGEAPSPFQATPIPSSIHSVPLNLRKRFACSNLGRRANPRGARQFLQGETGNVGVA